jgi:uncharacterized membrane protein
MKPNVDVPITAAAPASRALTPALAAAWVGLLLAGAIFGFFYAWVCSTMWGLDDADSRIAIAAMQAMNGSVRNAVFFPAFFLTPVVLGVAGALSYAERRTPAAALLGVAAATYVVGALLVTLLVNVPMNEALADVVIPSSEADAREIWLDYSTRWQRYNQLRTVSSGICLGLTGAALMVLHRRRTRQGRRT